MVESQIALKNRSYTRLKIERAADLGARCLALQGDLAAVQGQICVAEQIERQSGLNVRQKNRQRL